MTSAVPRPAPAAAAVISLMARHNYLTGRGGVEPNVYITPDEKWVVFTGQFGAEPRHVYALEIAAP
jgi:hypothetical protein